MGTLNGVFFYNEHVYQHIFKFLQYLHFVDINECETTEGNLCTQICTDMMGSYTCSCRDGYNIVGDTECEGFVLYSFILL